MITDQLESILGNIVGPQLMPWPQRRDPSLMTEFATFSDWRRCVLNCALPDEVPLIISAKYSRAQRLYVLSWLDGDIIKAGEMAAFAALELALKNRYGHLAKFRKQKASGDLIRPAFASLLKHMVTDDGLTDDQLPSIIEVNGSAVPYLAGGASPSLAERRNGLAHGDPFDGFPTLGLLPLIRDLIAYLHR